MLEYIAEALPGAPLLPKGAYDIYRAHASAQFLGGHLGLARAGAGLREISRAETRACAIGPKSKLP